MAFILAALLAATTHAPPARLAMPAHGQSCAAAWIEAHGRAPTVPAAPKSPTPTQAATYASAEKAWRVSYNIYQKDAADAGVTCIFGGPVTAPKSSTTAEVKALLDTAIGPTTTFVVNPPKDIAAFCPKYASASLAQKQQIWRNLFSAIIPHESGFKNASIMIDGDEYSIGLYQMSIHNGCAFKSEADAGDAAKNTACAVYKMAMLATPGRLRDTPKVKYGLIGGDLAHFRDGGASYWSTLRYKAPQHSQHDTTSRGEIVAATRASPGCL